MRHQWALLLTFQEVNSIAKQPGEQVMNAGRREQASNQNARYEIAQRQHQLVNARIVRPKAPLFASSFLHSTVGKQFFRELGSTVGFSRYNQDRVVACNRADNVGNSRVIQGASQ